MVSLSVVGAPLGSRLSKSYTTYGGEIVDEDIQKRFDFFKSVGFDDQVAMDMATYEYPNGVYFCTPVD